MAAAGRAPSQILVRQRTMAHIGGQSTRLTPERAFYTMIVQSSYHHASITHDGLDLSRSRISVSPPASPWGARHLSCVRCRLSQPSRHPSCFHLVCRLPRRLPEGIRSSFEPGRSAGGTKRKYPLPPCTSVFFRVIGVPFPPACHCTLLTCHESTTIWLS